MTSSTGTATSTRERSRSTGLAEKPILRETHELEVVCDTFHPLKLTKFAEELDDGRYWHSWYENAQDGAGDPASVHGDASGAGLTSHL